MSGDIDTQKEWEQSQEFPEWVRCFIFFVVGMAFGAIIFYVLIS